LTCIWDMPHILGENSVASDEGSAGSLTPTPSKNFKAVLREQVLVLLLMGTVALYRVCSTGLR